MINTEQNEIDIEALARKDKAAFAQLLNENSENVYRVALKMVGNAQDAEDILQETFIKAFNNIEKFEGRSKLSTWLYRIAVNESLMHLRKQKKHIEELDSGIQKEDGDILPRQIIDWCCIPEKELLNNESRRHLKSAIRTLSEANRAAFILRDVQGLSTRETAEALDISESAVKIRLMRARMQLREELTSFYAEKLAGEKL
jgi:RNA polymerase sigma-70 factor (ECF subfamily)